MNPLLKGFVERAEPLPQALAALRNGAAETWPAPELREWGRRRLKLTRDAEDTWFERARWGLLAGELLRAYLYDPALRPQVLALVDPPDWTPLESARRTGGMILATAHLGPPKTAMNLLFERPWPFVMWTNTVDLPPWVPESFRISFIQPANDPSALARTAMHLRDGGVLFGAPDVNSGKRTLTLERLGGPWTYSLGMPALARMLKLPVFQFLALWEGERIRVLCNRLPPPDPELPADEWDRQWVERYWETVEPVIRSSPENLRFLLFAKKGAIRRSLDL